MGYNIKEIAALAGVSKSTVSRVISGSGYASQEARERVMKVIETLQYKPSAVARAMVAQRTHNIGVIIFREQQPIVSHPLYGKIVDAILMAAGAKGYSVFLTTDREMSLRSTDFMLEKRVDGLILISRLRQNVIDYVKSFDIPYLMVNGSTDDPEVVQIVSKDEEGGERAASYLYQLGHRKIFIIAGPQEHRSHNLRLKGFCSSMERLGNSGGLTVVSSPESSADMGYRVMLENWDLFINGAFTSLFATNDMLALGAMKLLAERSVRIPEQVAVMGFDDIDFASMYSPSLTTVRVEKEKMGQDAVWMLDRLIRKEDGLPKLNEYASELIIRQST
ncbi:LacI family DNA-binding transcriptional regulator [Paenibacillus durus]|uniref:LacI family transcriptional regulator n=1 Tax=Paenibacillus durus ATCC 35681 TaxID=1333534 RepID=A0A0F7F739_PAEDU|nr:LacI family DNA-binding transcriptional regulator [Paenibacillus durus]AKG33227.1 LacI family transcriptional regulator [Paenibacillus durus ATCC 35681]